MNIVCIGGGPAGLYFSLLMKKRHPGHAITVFERHRADTASGWGVVLSDQTLERLAEADAASALAIGQAFRHWDAVDIRFKGRTIRSGGHGFCGIARRRLLAVLRDRCEELGVRLQYGVEADQDAQAGADLVIACDGLNSRLRALYAASYRPQVELGSCRYVWLGTTRPFAAFTFDFQQTEHGWFQAHAYQYDGAMSTVIVETPEAVWRAAGLDRMSGADGIAYCERLFAGLLDGHALQSHAAAQTGAAIWSAFARLVNAQWVHWNAKVPVVLMGDAAHSAHFSIGSGTRLAFEDAIELADCLGRTGGVANLAADLAESLQRYQQRRSTDVARLQSAARNSMEWFENVERYGAMEAPQFAYSMLTRSQRLSHENLRRRDAAYIAGYEAWWSARAHAEAGLDAPDQAPPPIFTPWRVRSLVLKNRIAVAPMAQYSAVDGAVGEYHLVHLGARAMGGAALVFTEMTGVSADARITPACPGMYAPAHAAAWRRIVDFIHAGGDAKVALQLGHAGPKGSTRPMWDGIDQPLAEGNWALLAASEQQYLPGVSQRARAADAADMARIEADFVAATRMAALAGFDWLELHCAHGYLLSSFISPLTNGRGDEYGGCVANRCRFPLRVFAAMRAVWPAGLPMSVRISAHDWTPGGTTPDDAVAIARLFKAAGADVIDCSSGQVSKQERPVYGRMFQTPFADRVRNEAQIASIAVGAISDADQANGIIASGRADLCAVGRPHLANPAWTLSEAARFGWQAPAWPRPYRPARAQFERGFRLSEPSA